MASAASGLRLMQNVVPLKQEKSGVRFTRLARRVVLILDADGATMVLEQERDCVSQVELVDRVIKARTLAHLNDGTLPNVLVSELQLSSKIFLLL